MRSFYHSNVDIVQGFVVPAERELLFKSSPATGCGP